MSNEILGCQSLDRMIRETIAVRDYEKVISERGEYATRNQELQSRQRDYEEVKRERDEALSKLSDENQKAVEIIKCILLQLEKPPSERVFGKELLESGVVASFEGFIEDSVSKRLKAAEDNSLREKFEKVVGKRVQEKLASWEGLPMHEHGVKKLEIAKLEDKQRADPFVALRGEWGVRCSSCGSFHTLGLNRIYDIRELLCNGYIDVPYLSLNASSLGTHPRRVTLEEVVELYLKKD